MQLLGHLLQVARRVADTEKLEDGYRIGERSIIICIEVTRFVCIL